MTYSVFEQTKNAIIEDSFHYDGSLLDGAPENDDYEKMSAFDPIIISYKNKLYTLWFTLEIFCCFISPYLYAYLAAFQNPHSGDVLFNILYSFEAIFLVSILLNFLLEYVDEGTQRPVRDLEKIGNRYYNSSFKRDLIPLVPL